MTGGRQPLLPGPGEVLLPLLASSLQQDIPDAGDRVGGQPHASLDHAGRA